MKYRNRSLAALLALACTLPFLGVTPAVAQTSKKTQTQQKSKKAPAPPEVLHLPDGTDLPIAEIVLRADADQKRIDEGLGKLRALAIPQVAGSVVEIDRTIQESVVEVRSTIDFARTSMPLNEVQFLWSRYRNQLEALNMGITRAAGTLAEQQEAIQKIRKYWEAVSAEAHSAKLQPELLAAIDGVVQVADKALAQLRDAGEQIVELQVRAGAARKQVDDVLQLTAEAQQKLTQQLFARDAPPIWSLFRDSQYASIRTQFHTFVNLSKARFLRFTQSSINALFWYAIFAALFTFGLARLSRNSPELLVQEAGPAAPLLNHPYLVAAFLVLSTFEIFFTAAPLQVRGLANLIKIFPVVWLAAKVFNPKFRPALIGLGVFFALDIITAQMMAGTVLRRLISLALSALSLAGLAWLLRKGSSITNSLVEKHWSGAQFMLRAGGVLLLVGLISNVVGNISLADLLTNGAIISTYAALALFVFYLVLVAMIAAITVSPFGQYSRAVRNNRELVNRKLRGFFRLACWVLWIAGVLVAFQISRQLADSASGILTRKWGIGAVSISLLDVVLFFVVLAVGTAMAKLIRFFMEEEVFPRTSVATGAAQATSRLTYIALITVGFFLALGAAGLELSKITVLTGAFGVGLGFGLQNVVNNFVSGIIVSLERPVQVGDIVEAAGLQGEITHIGFRSSTVMTFDGADVIVPNAELVTKNVVNWSLSNQYRRTEIQIGAAYGTDPAKVLRVLNEIAAANPRVNKNPAPLITFDSFGDSSLNFTLRFWSRLDARIEVRSELNAAIARRFAEEGIVIPFPQRDLHVYSADAKESGPLPGERGARAAGTSD